MIEKIRARYHQHPKAFLLQCVAVVFVPLLLGGILLVSHEPSAELAKVVPKQRISLFQGVKINFSVPVSRASFSASIEPNIEGEWRWDNPLIGSALYRQAEFVPSEPYQPDTEYKITVHEIKNATNIGRVGSDIVTFVTQPIPKIISIGVSDDQSVIAPIPVRFDYPTNNTYEYYFSLYPSATIAVTKSADGESYLLTPEQPLQQGITYQLIVEQEAITFDTVLQKIIRRAERAEIARKTFTTKEPLGITSVAPQGAEVSPETKSVTIVFAEPVNQEQALQYLAINPPIEGTWKWDDARTVTYQLNGSLGFDMSYTVTIKPGLPAASGATLLSEGAFRFSTLGSLKVRSTVPSLAKTGISRQSAIRIQFNQPVRSDSVARSLTMQPDFAYNAAWQSSDTVLVLTPLQPLDFNTRYSIEISTGATSSLGRPLERPYSFWFITEERTVQLALALDKQDRALSCEVAALKMALSYKGVAVSEDELMLGVGYDPTIRSNGVWGDPDVAFVGDINGSQNTTGYGVHWGPIAQVAQKYRPATARTAMTLTDLAREIDAGNPIVVWGTQGRAYYDPWTTPAGKLVPAWKGEHARTVIGYKGSTAEPTAIIVNDPIAGRVVWAARDFDANWARLSRAGVVVY